MKIKRRSIFFSVGKYIRGFVNPHTGDIFARHHVGLLSYNYTIEKNINDPVNLFPYTEEDRVILAARKAIKEMNFV